MFEQLTKRERIWMQNINLYAKLFQDKLLTKEKERGDLDDM